MIALLKRDRTVYTEIAPDSTKATITNGDTLETIRSIGLYIYMSVHLDDNGEGELIKSFKNRY